MLLIVIRPIRCLGSGASRARISLRRRGADDQQHVRFLERPAEQDEAVIDQRIHEIRMRPPSFLLFHWGAVPIGRPRCG